MTISTEAIIGIVGVFVGLPPLILIVCNLRNRENRKQPDATGLHQILPI
jgi:hypothetical protein